MWSSYNWIEKHFSNFIICTALSIKIDATIICLLPSVFNGIVCPSRNGLRDFCPFVAFVLVLLLSYDWVRIIELLWKRSAVDCLKKEYVLTSMIIASSSGDHAARLISGFRWLYHLSRHCLPSLPFSCLAINDQLFIPCFPTSSQTLSSSYTQCKIASVEFFSKSSNLSSRFFT